MIDEMRGVLNVLDRSIVTANYVLRLHTPTAIQMHVKKSFSKNTQLNKLSTSRIKFK